VLLYQSGNHTTRYHTMTKLSAPQSKNSDRMSRLPTHGRGRHHIQGLIDIYLPTYLLTYSALGRKEIGGIEREREREREEERGVIIHNLLTLLYLLTYCLALTYLRTIEANPYTYHTQEETKRKGGGRKGSQLRPSIPLNLEIPHIITTNISHPLTPLPSHTQLNSVS
jgi:hypothetical protein